MWKIGLLCLLQKLLYATIFSAGVGRTGTYIALDALYQEGQKTGKINVPMYVRTMRKDRMNMIQGDVSLFIYIMKDALKPFFMHLFLRVFNRIVLYIFYCKKKSASIQSQEIKVYGSMTILGWIYQKLVSYIKVLLRNETTQIRSLVYLSVVNVQEIYILLILFFSKDKISVQNGISSFNVHMI